MCHAAYLIILITTQGEGHEHMWKLNFRKKKWYSHLHVCVCNSTKQEVLMYNTLEHDEGCSISALTFLKESDVTPESRYNIGFNKH